MCVCNDFNVKDCFKNYTLNQLQQYVKENTRPFGVGIFNLKGSLNTGNIIRTAAAFSAADFFIIGNRQFDRRSLVGAGNYINVVYMEEYNIDIINSLGYYPVFIEQGGKDINTFIPKGKPLLIFGNEATGIPEKYLTEEHYSITQTGVIRSLNVSSAAAIAINIICLII
jgi:tRNA G18 (ribose-2'-O)-methylase SpoU